MTYGSVRGLGMGGVKRATSIDIAVMRSTSDFIFMSYTSSEALVLHTRQHLFYVSMMLIEQARILILAQTDMDMRDSTTMNGPTLYGGNGRDISIWHDTWVRNEPLSNTIRNRSVYEEILNNNARVDDMYDEGKWKWLEKWLNSLCSLLIGAGYVGDFSVIDGHLGVKGAAPPCEVKGQRPLLGSRCQITMRNRGLYKGARQVTRAKGKEDAGPSVNMAEARESVNTGHFRGIGHSVIIRTQICGSEKGQKNHLSQTKMQYGWIDSGATTHVCKDRCWFKTYEPVKDGSVLYMGDDHFAPVHGKGSLESDNRETPEPRKGKRVRKAKSYGSDFQLYLVEGSRDQIGSQYSYCYSIEEDPRTYNEAMRSRDSVFWKEAIDEEIGIDYFNTYAPVARITTIRLLLALAAIHNLVIHKIDVKTIFLNGDLEEEVYMKQPEGFVLPGNEHKVCKLVKSLYGLKQAPKQWHQKFNEVVLLSGFLLNQSDKCVYSKFDSFGKGVIICLYVDDMLIFGTDQNQVEKTKKFLSLRFSMKDIGEADVILGIKIKRENKGIIITQSHYIEKILKKFNREDCSPISTPMDSVEKLKPNTGKPVDQLEYSRVIGCLMYTMTSTRPDIAYAVGRLSRFTSNPSGQHWHAITRVFKYLKGTMNYGLSYVGYPSVLEASSDASWINHVEDSSSTSGWVFLFGGGVISWVSKKQTYITDSTMESEFVALATAGKEAEWLRNFIHEIPIWPKP
ncbi:zinc finger, CCHC-type containing protein, partial [Tanacetum coccineum]